MQMINAPVKTQHKNNSTYKHHMQFLTSAPNFRGSADPSDPAFPSPWKVETNCSHYFTLYTVAQCGRCVIVIITWVFDDNAFHSNSKPCTLGGRFYEHQICTTGNRHCQLTKSVTVTAWCYGLSYCVVWLRGVTEIGPFLLTLSNPIKALNRTRKQCVTNYYNKCKKKLNSLKQCLTATRPASHN